MSSKGEREVIQLTTHHNSQVVVMCDAQKDVFFESPNHTFSMLLSINRSTSSMNMINKTIIVTIEQDTTGVAQ